MFRQAEVVVLLLAKLHLAPFGAEFAIRPALLVREKLLLADAVISALRGLVNPAAFAGRRVLFIPEPLKNGAHTLLMALIGGRRPAVVFHLELLPQGHEFRGDGIDKFLRRHTLLLRGLLHLLPVLIHSREEKDIVSRQPMVPGDHIGEHLLVGMPDVRRAIGVIDGGRDEKRGGMVRMRRHRFWRINFSGPF